MNKATIIYRARIFSPNSVENDRLILKKTAEFLQQKGYSTTEITEEQLINSPSLLSKNEPSEAPSLILTMARSTEALHILKSQAAQSASPSILNAPSGIEECSDRQALIQEMKALAIPVPPEEGNDGTWLKRSKGTAEVPEDTVFCTSEEEIGKAVAAFHERGIHEIVRQAHVKGDLVKFYGVAKTPFFHFFYPTDTGRSKFGSEAHNGQAHHFPFSVTNLQEAVNRLATHIGVCIYGGDAIVREDGSFVIIDFNDWPTFSPCREEAAKAIASLADSMVSKSSDII